MSPEAASAAVSSLPAGSASQHDIRNGVWRRPSLIASPWRRWALILGFLLYLAIALDSVAINWDRVAQGMARGWRFIAAFASPDFFARSGEIIDGLLESLAMTVVATVIGIIISIPVGLGAARNLSPTPVYLFCRAWVGLARAFPEIIFAILFVKMFGFGPLAGMLTLVVASVGFLAKLLADEIETLDRSQMEAVRATGASWLQWVNYAIQPQVMPRLAGLSLYRLDINFRESAVIGIVGAGGIGATLNTSFDRYEFETAAAILLLIIAIVMMTEYASGYLRKALQ
ncbi:phosphonate ABC transporter, permease protein PhnE [Paracandidimonas soli]|uniref:phosphonate ABC transporter, permease protein PhnE n=1 Tax=Paracandidimonas soli TaxID=1917182 RepID=UPI00333E1AC7